MYLQKAYTWRALLMNINLSTSFFAKDGTAKKEVPLQHLIEEIEIDTTPRKSMVFKVLGGDFTFLGQYEEEGTMVMIRRPDWESEGSTEDALPVNPHPLQPPLHRVEVRGDLLLRVAETEEELDCADNEEKEEDGKKSEDGSEDDAAEGGDGGAKKAAVHVPTNNEFFLDYTREEYLTFAARTDIVAEEVARGGTARTRPRSRRGTTTAKVSRAAISIRGEARAKATSLASFFARGTGDESGVGRLGLVRRFRPERDPPLDAADSRPYAEQADRRGSSDRRALGSVLRIQGSSVQTDSRSFQRPARAWAAVRRLRHCRHFSRRPGGPGRTELP